MFLKNSLNYINQFFFFFTNKTRNFYLNSIIYNKKKTTINKIMQNSLTIPIDHRYDFEDIEYISKVSHDIINN